MSQDRNFDKLYERFSRNIKQSGKGLLRETLIREDLETHIPELRAGGLRGLDAGCGLGDMSLWLAAMGHEMQARDISEKMVNHAQRLAAEAGLSARIQVAQESVQSALQSGQTYQLICIHAVMEWLEHPYELLPLVPPALEPGGWFSLTVYNLHRSVFNALIKGDFKSVLRGHFGGGPKSLTPPNPVRPERVREQLEALGLRVAVQGGLRCFHDAMSADAKEEHSFEDILALERRYRFEAPYRDMARYVHFLVQKPRD